MFEWEITCVTGLLCLCKWGCRGSEKSVMCVNGRSCVCIGFRVAVRGVVFLQGVLCTCGVRGIVI